MTAKINVLIWSIKIYCIANTTWNQRGISIYSNIQRIIYKTFAIDLFHVNEIVDWTTCKKYKNTY